MAKKKNDHSDKKHVCISKINGRCYSSREFRNAKEAIRYAMSSREVVAIITEDHDVLWCAHGESVIVYVGNDPWAIIANDDYDRGRSSSRYDKFKFDRYLTVSAEEWLSSACCPLCRGMTGGNIGVATCFGGRICRKCDKDFARTTITPSPLPSMREHKYHHTFKVEHTLADGTVINYPVPLTAGGR